MGINSLYIYRGYIKGNIMGISSVALKAFKLIPKYAFSDGAGAISKARKATISSETKSIFGKGNEFALKNSKTKISAGWDALKKDAVKTMNSKKSIWAGLRSFGKSLISKPKQGIRVAEKLAQRAGKTAGFWAKTGGALKGFGIAIKKLPIVGTLLSTGYEIYETYNAFKNGGVWEGTKQILKSTASIAGFAVGTALGAVVGGPVGAIIGGLACDMLVRHIVGGSYSDNHPKAEENADEPANEQGESSEISDTKSEDTSTDSQTGSSEPVKNTEVSEDKTSGTTTANPAIVTNPSSPSTSNPFASGSDVSNPFGLGLNIPNPVTLGFGSGIGMSNPFGTGFGLNPMMGGMGYMNPAMPQFNLGLQPGENIFLKYPMGYQFQYIGQ